MSYKFTFLKNLSENFKAFQKLSPDQKMTVLEYLKEPRKLLEVKMRGESEKIAVAIYKSVRGLLDSGFQPREITKQLAKMGEFDPSFVMLTIQNVQSVVEKVPSQLADLKTLASIKPDELQKLLEAIVKVEVSGSFDRWTDLLMSTGLNLPVTQCEAIRRLFVNYVHDLLSADIGVEKIQERFDLVGVPKSSQKIFITYLTENLEQLRAVYIYKLLRDAVSMMDDISSRIERNTDVLQDLLQLLKTFFSRTM